MFVVSNTTLDYIVVFGTGVAYGIIVLFMLYGIFRLFRACCCSCCCSKKTNKNQVQPRGNNRSKAATVAGSSQNETRTNKNLQRAPSAYEESMLQQAITESTLMDQRSREDRDLEKAIKDSTREEQIRNRNNSTHCFDIDQTSSNQSNRSTYYSSPYTAVPPTSSYTSNFGNSEYPSSAPLQPVEDAHPPAYDYSSFMTNQYAVNQIAPAYPPSHAPAPLHVPEPAPAPIRASEYPRPEYDTQDNTYILAPPPAQPCHHHHQRGGSQTGSVTMVNCPNCNLEISSQAINTHLDQCLV